MRWQKETIFLINDFHSHILIKAFIKASIVGSLINLANTVVRSVLRANFPFIVFAPTGAARDQFSFPSLVTDETGAAILVCVL